MLFTSPWRLLVLLSSPAPRPGSAHCQLSNRDGPARPYLTDAIFPFYIVHQTTIVVAGHSLAQQRLPLGIETSLLIVTTVASCFIAYEVVRRVGPLRPIFGLKDGHPRAAAEHRCRPIADLRSRERSIADGARAHGAAGGSRSGGRLRIWRYIATARLI
jgi:hypothetical protein